ncbi:MAG: alpha/beta fold hydrolase [Myxococcales bacterium]
MVSRTTTACDVSGRQEVRFQVDTESCAGWWYPARGPGLHPAIVMAHGFGATRELGLDAFARRFHQAGISVLVFDYRHYGGSSGYPRELLSIRRQLADFRAAIAFARTLPNVDPSRICIWGSSFGGGHVMTLAAEELGIRAAISQVPFSSGLASALRIPWLTALRIFLAGLVDLVRGVLGRSPAYIPLIGHPGQLAMMSAPDSKSGYQKLVSPEVEASGRWQNRVSARIGLTIPFYAPGLRLAKARVPVLVAVAEQDSIAPATATVRAALRSRNVQLVCYPLGHFDYYTDAGFERIVADEREFLLRNLTSGPSRANVGVERTGQERWHSSS